jgi:methylenetetrahydrofolate reductase (NADPH)
MIEYANPAEHAALAHTTREAYMEVFPTATVEQRLDALEPGAYVAVTCSPAKGVDETLQMTARLAGRGFRVVPHIAAKMVRDRSHLAEIMAELNDLPVESIFVPGGDAARPAGDFHTAYELLREIAGFDHRFSQIGVAAHPEGHPDVPDDTLLSELEKKQPLATYLVTQMCFDTILLAKWLEMIRSRGILLPAWIGIPGVSDRASLLKTSLRIGVGDSLRFLRRKSVAARQLMKNSAYTPDALLSGLAPVLADPAYAIDGFHIFCFNQVEKTEQWRRAALESLRAPGSRADGLR